MEPRYRRECQRHHPDRGGARRLRLGQLAVGRGLRPPAVPWNELRLSEAGDRVVIDMTREEMEALPAYTGDPASVAGIDADAKPVQ
jgi:hypothetical protein